MMFICLEFTNTYEFRVQYQHEDWDLMLTGSFSVSVDDHHPEVTMDHVWDEDHDLEFKLPENHEELLCQEIETEGGLGEWEADKISGEADRAYDEHRDSLMEVG